VNHVSDGDISTAGERSMKFTTGIFAQAFVLPILILAASATTPVVAAIQQAEAVPLPAKKPVIVEWVYRIQYGHKDEWWRIFKKYQIAILDRQKQLGYVKEYTVFAPSLHTSEDSRWDYRVVIVRTSEDPPPGQSEADIAKQLFPDQEAFTREENRRWELTTNHWDLPIHVVNANAAD
jgi:hypothetical protein